MAFQFQCPHGHLLTGEVSQAGQQCLCPMCGVLFIVPMPIGFAAPPAVPTVAPPPMPSAGPYLPAVHPSHPPYQEAEPTPANPFAALRAAAEAAETASPRPAEVTAPAPPVEPAVLHIPCPQGHVLETPEEMLDQEVLCPHCRARFVLRRHSSVEYKRQKEEQERIREIKAGNFWLNLAIVVVVLVVLGLAALIVARNLMQTPVHR